MGYGRSAASSLTRFCCNAIQSCRGASQYHELPNSTPYTLHPTPCASCFQYLNPTPYTLHPTPYTLHPTPYTLDPRPYTPHPVPAAFSILTLHSTPYTLHPTPHILCQLLSSSSRASYGESELQRKEGKRKFIERQNARDLAAMAQSERLQVITRPYFLYPSGHCMERAAGSRILQTTGCVSRL